MHITAKLTNEYSSHPTVINTDTVSDFSKAGEIPRPDASASEKELFLCDIFMEFTGGGDPTDPCPTYSGVVTDTSDGLDYFLHTEFVYD